MAMDFVPEIASEIAPSSNIILPSLSGTGHSVLSSKYGITA